MNAALLYMMFKNGVSSIMQLHAHLYLSSLNTGMVGDKGIISWWRGAS